MSYMISVKFSGRTHAVEIEGDQTIEAMKDQMCKKYDLDSNSVRIVFQGKELSDSLVIKESDLSDFSVVHILQKPQQGLQSASGLNVVSSLIDSQVTNSASEAGRRLLYYVYCKTVCQDVKPARLRVRCGLCKQGTLQVDREPCDWDDVLRPTQITGTCLSEGCNGNTAEFYFKCNGHSTEEENESVVLSQITGNIQDLPCITCSDNISPILVFKCDSNHVMCLQCFREYCQTRLNDRAFVYSPQFGYTLGCPAGCPDSLIEEAHHFRVQGAEQYERYQQFAAEECLLQEDGVMCPAPGCGEGVFPGDVRRVQCVNTQCLFVFCRDCHREYHAEEGCERAVSSPVSLTSPYEEDRSVPEQQDHASLQTISDTTKPCPNCKTPTERNGGCLHMTCSRCQFDWCWLCQKIWDRNCQGDHWFG